MLKITQQQIDNILKITCYNRKARLDILQQKCRTHYNAHARHNTLQEKYRRLNTTTGLPEIIHCRRRARDNTLQ